MNGDPAARPPELVIIRRRAGDAGDTHKGGVWKIAYADFMTAMMAFFLVMWLINAANEATRSQVASYFNPVKLVDSRTNVKGLQDLDTGSEGPAKQKPASDGDHQNVEGLPLEATKAEHTEQSLFKDPYVVLAELAKEAGAGSDTDVRRTGVLAEQSGRPGLQGGEGFVDPFDPATWSTITEASNPSEERRAGESPATGIDKALAAEIEAVRSGAKEAEKAAEVAARTEAEARADKPEGAGKTGKDDKPAEGEAASGRKADEPDAGIEKLRQEIEIAAGQAGRGHAPLVEVKATEEGVLLSLTDASDFAMFDIASAKPKAELVRFMEKVATVLNAREGRIVVRGHTDGRAFRSDTYDNWRLSAARAHMAYYMLVRGGIDEKRVERIEGHADRHLKQPANPEASENRRIEILLREQAS